MHSFAHLKRAEEEARERLTIVFFAVNGTEMWVTSEQHIHEAALGLMWKSDWFVPRAFPQPSSNCGDAVLLNLTLLLGNLFIWKCLSRQKDHAGWAVTLAVHGTDLLCLPMGALQTGYIGEETLQLSFHRSREAEENRRKKWAGWRPECLCLHLTILSREKFIQLLKKKIPKEKVEGNTFKQLWVSQQTGS